MSGEIVFQESRNNLQGLKSGVKRLIGKLYHTFRIQEILNQFTLVGTFIVMNKAYNSSVTCMFVCFMFVCVCFFCFGFEST